MLDFCLIWYYFLKIEMVLLWGNIYYSKLLDVLGLYVKIYWLYFMIFLNLVLWKKQWYQ